MATHKTSLLFLILVLGLLVSHASAFTISGTITDADTAAAISGVTIHIQSVDFSEVHETTTDTNGDYTSPDLPSNTYVVLATDDATYVDEFYPDIPCEFGFCILPGDASGDVVVTENLTGIDIQLKLCPYCDLFDDGILDSQITILKGTWDEINGLRGISDRKARMIASPRFSGCDVCQVGSVMGSIIGGTGARVSLLAWYQDSKNYVELMINPETGKALLKQRVNGVVLAKKKMFVDFGDTFDFGFFAISFDGSTFTVLFLPVQATGAVASMTMAAAPGSSPFGTVGYQAKATTAFWSTIAVY